MSYETFIHSISYLKKSATATLTTDKNSLTNAASQSRAHDVIAWHAQSWMEASHTLDFVNWILNELSSMTQEVYEQSRGDAVKFEEEFAAGFLHIKSIAASECLRTVYQGADFSSNPMSHLNNTAKIAAVKKVMEVFSLGYHNLTNADNVLDILAGEERRKIEEHNRKKLVPASIKLAKVGSKYEAHVLNCFNELIDSEQLISTTKTGANAEAHAMADAMAKMHDTYVYVIK